MVCHHQENLIADILTVLAILVAFFMFRELICWFFKTNCKCKE